MLRVAPLTVPVLLLPEASTAVVPDASSKPQAPTRLVSTGLTVSVTATVLGEPVAPAAATVTSAVYVPAANPVIDGVTVTVPAFVPLPGDTIIQLALSDAVQSIDPLPVFDTANVLAAGDAPPTVALNASVAGVTDSTGGAGGSTVNVTATVFGEPVAPAAAIVTSVV